MSKIKITCKGQKCVSIDRIECFYGNLKEIGKSDLEKLKRSIIKHGFSFPVFVWEDLILDGLQRIYATRELLKEGWEINGIPIVEISAKDKSEAAEKLLLVNSRYAKIYDEGLASFIKEFDLDIMDIAGDLELSDINMDDFLASLMGDGPGGLTDDDDVPDVPEKPVTKKGDLYILDGHRLLCGDAMKKEDAYRLMVGEKAGMVFTDPPYNVDYTGSKKERRKIINDALNEQKFNELLLGSYKNMFNSTVEGGAVYICHADKEWKAFRQNMVDSGWLLKQCLIWVKKQFVLGRQDYHWRHEPILYGWKPGKKHKWYGKRNKGTVFDDIGDPLIIAQKDESANIIINIESKIIVIKVPSYEIVYNNNEELTTTWNFPKPLKSEDHPTQKPIALIERAIMNSSQKTNVIIDFFGGSGSTLIACEKTGRKCFMMELDPPYCDVIVKRWENYTGKKAVLDG